MRYVSKLETSTSTNCSLATWHQLRRARSYSQNPLLNVPIRITCYIWATQRKTLNEQFSHVDLHGRLEPVLIRAKCLQAARHERFENALVLSAETACDEVLNREFLPKWAWRAIPGMMLRIGKWVHRDLVTEPRIDALLTEQSQMHAWIEVSLGSI